MPKTIALLPLLRPLLLPALGLLASSGCVGPATGEPGPAGRTEAFPQAEESDWEEVFFDPGTGDWRTRWTLDGEKATVENGPEGMSFTAGPTPGEQASHAVLWTRDSFEGDIRLDYRYTRLDDAQQYVTILYVQATGSGEGPHHEDISTWAELRTRPVMKVYFDNMNTYHISYAAFTNEDVEAGENRPDYLRARRYRPDRGGGLKGTELVPDNRDTGFFEPGVEHHITVIKQDDDLWMRVRTDERSRVYHWDTSTQPAIASGRIGLRHMWTRAARYADFRVSVRPE